MRHFAVFGIHPRLSLAEWRAVRPGLTSEPIPCEQGAVFDDPSWDGKELMDRVGGTTKLGDIVLETNVRKLNPTVLAELLLSHPRDEKVIFGFTVLGGTPAVRARVEKYPLGLKRELKARGRSVRWVTSKGGEPLSPAAVAKLDLTASGYDLVILLQGEDAYVGLTTHVQDADAWSLRDYGRPVRDDVNGMLPPKLARILVNLAKLPSGGTLCDPFCGSGTILMEAGLAEEGAHIIGSDADPKQVADTQKNLDWLFVQNILPEKNRSRFTVFMSDARKLGGQVNPGQIDRVVTEGYLGPPLHGHETRERLEKNAEDITALWRETLAALHPLLAQGGRVICIWPSFKNANGEARVDLSRDPDITEKYTVLNGDPLVYERPGQRIARRIFILEKH